MSDQPRQQQQASGFQKDADGFDEGLDVFFAAARNSSPAPSPALLRRVMDDAMDVQGARHALPTGRATAKRQPSLWVQLRDALGGWPALGGLAMAGVAGLAIGIAAPGGLGDLTRAAIVPAAMQDGYLVDLAPEMEFDIVMDLNEG